MNRGGDGANCDDPSWIIGNASSSQLGDAIAAGSEWFIRTMRRRRILQDSSTAKLKSRRTLRVLLLSHL